MRATLGRNSFKIPIRRNSPKLSNFHHPRARLLPNFFVVPPSKVYMQTESGLLASERQVAAYEGSAGVSPHREDLASLLSSSKLFKTIYRQSLSKY
jgi:hypothetical protein